MLKITLAMFMGVGPWEMLSIMVLGGIVFLTTSARLKMHRRRSAQISSPNRNTPRKLSSGNIRPEQKLFYLLIAAAIAIIALLALVVFLLLH